jgi:hypothetical protein
VTEAAVRVRVDAQNRKAARRAANSRLVFGTFPPVSIRGDRHTRVDLAGVSPPSVPATQRMIPPARPIPLGAVQIMRPAPQPTTPTAWSADVRLDVFRFRFTPARGEFYGPPAAAQATPPAVAAVAAGTHDFLRPGAGWLNSARDGRPVPLQVVAPADTIDERQRRSLGVVDDTCEARLDVVLSLPGRGDLSAHANLFVAPPDFGPDRRPFLSVADELNDRVGDPATRDVGLDPDLRDTWAEDLFERIFETVSLFNVDHYRQRWSIAELPEDRLVPEPGIEGDGLPDATRSLGRRDALRNPDLEPLAAPDPPERPLPLSARARERHRSLSDIDFLKAFVRENPGRLAELVRGPFELDPIESDFSEQTMRMPPFMRHSNGNALTLSAWQYALLMSWVQAAEATPGPAAAPAARPMPGFAARRRADVLARLGRRSPS